MGDWWSWARHAIRLPTRAVPLAIIAAGFAVAIANNGRARHEVTPWQQAVQMVAGVCVVVVVLGWRRFWYGPAVARRRQPTDT